MCKYLVLLGMEITVEFRGRQVDYMLETRGHSTSYPILRSMCRTIIETKNQDVIVTSIDYNNSRNVTYSIDYDNIGSNARSQQENFM